MKYILTTIILQFSLLCLATPPAEVENLTSSFTIAEETIDDQMNTLNEINAIILSEGLTYKEFSTAYPSLHAESNLAANSFDGLFDVDHDSPLGIHGFWWGLALGCLGLGIVYFAMEEGVDRSEHVKNAAIGCLISGLLGGGLWFSVFR